MKEKELKIKELRMMEAVKKNLMGISGKIGVIAREMGEAIMDDSGTFMSEEDQYLGRTTTPFVDFYAEDKEYDNILDQLPTIIEINDVGEMTKYFEGDEWYQKQGEQRLYNPRVIGWGYSGLSRGMNLDIHFLYEDGALKVSWNGQKVFYETGGDLVIYVPMKEWEEKIDDLYTVARAKNKNRITLEKENIKNKSEKYKQGFLEKMKKFWGV